MSKLRSKFVVRLLAGLTILILTAGLFSACGGKGGSAAGNGKGGLDYTVEPGEKDEYLGFWSAGPFGGVWVVGLPSMRILREIPVFEQRAAYGYGFDAETRALIEPENWGDTHHPALSETKGEYDGKLLFINDKANGKLAKIDLRTFKTVAITRIPNVQGSHGTAVDPDTRYVFVAAELERPANQSADAGEPGSYISMLSAVDPQTMLVKWQVLTPGNTDMIDVSKDGRYVLATMYNTEMAVTLEGMIKADRDGVAVIDITKAEEAIAAGKYTEMGGTKVLKGAEVENLLQVVPVPKNPHGVDVDPTGRYAIANGKLSPTASVIDLQTLKVVAEPELGAGPLHSQFDDKGNAYTTMFLDSTIVKWNIKAAVEGKPKEEYIVDVIDVHYNPGHLAAAEGDTVSPDGNWLVSLNKLAKDRFTNIGPDFAENEQLIDISGKKMKLVYDMPIVPEPHYAQIIKADKLKPIEVWDLQEGALETKAEPVAEGKDRIERRDGKVYIYTTARRSEYGLKEMRVKQGERVVLNVTNIETTKDIIHGLAIPEYGINKSLAPGETVRVEFTADKPGVYWLYCTWFCSALHLEMRSRLVVESS